MRTSSSDKVFGPLVEECANLGISRTVAFELAAKGQLETFKIGARRYVLLESLRSLPGRLTSSSDESTGGEA